MSQHDTRPSVAPTAGDARSAPATGSPSTGELLSRLSAEVSQLVRDELRLAQVEATSKAKQAGIGAGMFGASGLLALYGVAVLIATAILALALVVDAWLAALIVGIVLLVAAGIAALLGRNRIQEAVPPVPERAVESVKADIAAVRHHGHDDRGNGGDHDVRSTP